MLRLGALKKKQTGAMPYPYLLAASDGTIESVNSCAQIVANLPPTALFFLQTMGHRVSTRVHASSAALASGVDAV